MLYSLEEAYWYCNANRAIPHLKSMLDKIDLSRVFNAAHKKGFTRVELYAEEREETEISLRGRLQDTRLNTQTGIALTLSDGEASRVLSTNQVSTKALLDLLDNQMIDFTEAQALPEPQDAHLLKERVQILKTALRKSAANLDSPKAPELRYEDVVRRFEVSTDPSHIFQGVEESANAFWKFETEAQDQKRVIQDGHSRSSVGRFWESFSENSLVPKLPESWFNPWPSPGGPLPVLWQPKAFAKLLLPFIRAFEGDLVLKKMSFLSRMEEKLPLAFGVDDTPHVDRSHWDHEGSPLTQSTLFSDGVAKTIVCDKEIAELLQTSSTGHGRRESYLNQACVGLWNAHLKSGARQPDFLSKLAQGISIEDIVLEDFNPFSGSIQFQTKDAFLIHHGEAGEALAPARFKTSLLSILASMKEFGEMNECFGYTIRKQGQDVLTEVNVPTAFSPELDYPGEVSPQHYW